MSIIIGAGEAHMNRTWLIGSISKAIGADCVPKVNFVSCEVFAASSNCCSWAVSGSVSERYSYYIYQDMGLMLC